MIQWLEHTAWMAGILPDLMDAKQHTERQTHHLSRLTTQVFLDKFWFGPVGRTLEERDAFLREKLASVKGDSGELERLQVRLQEEHRCGRTQGGHSHECTCS